MQTIGLDDLAKLMNKESSDEKTFSDEQRVTQLTEAYEVLQEEYVFTPGDMIIHKLPNAAYVKHAAHPVVFVRYLSKPLHGWEHVSEPNDIGYPSAAIVQDCIILVLDSQGDFTKYLAESELYRPYEGG